MTKRVIKNLVDFTPTDVASKFAEFEKASSTLENHGAVLGTYVALCYRQGGEKLVAEYFNAPLAKLNNDPKSEGFDGEHVKRVRQVINYNTDKKLTIKNKDKTKMGMIVTTPEKRAKKEIKLAVAVKALDLAITVINQTTLLDATVKTELANALGRVKKRLSNAILANDGVSTKTDKSDKVAEIKSA